MLKRARAFSAGDLTKRATLLEPIEGENADGRVVQSWADRGEVWCNLTPRRGGEGIVQARMESRNPAIITVRASGLTREITSEWRVVIDGRRYEVQEDPTETQDRGYLEFLAMTRGAE